MSSPSKSSLSLLLNSTNEILSSCASLTNKTVSLTGPSPIKSKKIPQAIIKSQANLLMMRRLVRTATAQEQSNVNELNEVFKKARVARRKLERQFKADMSKRRDEKLFQLATPTPSSKASEQIKEELLPGFTN